MRARHQVGAINTGQTANPRPDAERLARCKTFAEFYPLYLAEHSNATCRRLHFAGSTLALLCLFFLVFTGNVWLLAMAAFCGYAFAWAGHYFFEHNRPATFIRPLYSLMGDWVMWWQLLSGRLAC
ncbi:MAG: DUF962 domain-containing protein [Betaproteobacteria bacterium]|nr:DUF962 domain-containing protein [Betaproteobacteria bacterium]